MTKDLSRRVFLERMSAGTVGGALSGVLARRARASGGSSHSMAWKKPPIQTSPNILIIMVDQMRWPAWLSSTQMTTLSQTYLPNIMGRLYNNSYIFQQYYAAATMCVPSRSTLLTGLYAPQTAVYETG